MKTAIIYYSKSGRTKKVANKFNLDKFRIPKEIPNEDYDLYIFLCPTYGDEELPLPMEDFLINLKLKNKKYCVCELGNYYGYDDYEFGAYKLIKFMLNKLNWQEFYNPLSLDSMPNINWKSFDCWITNLNIKINNE